MSPQVVALLDCLLLGYQFVGKLDCGLWFVDCWIIILKIVQKAKTVEFHRFGIGLLIFGRGTL